LAWSNDPFDVFQMKAYLIYIEKIAHENISRTPTIFAASGANAHGLLG
jgi:hypothetical protein